MVYMYTSDCKVTVNGESYAIELTLFRFQVTNIFQVFFKRYLGWTRVCTTLRSRFLSALAPADGPEKTRR